MFLAASVQPARGCEPGQWFLPGGARQVSPQQVLSAAAKQDVVLLGENHDDADHHLWQLQTLAALHLLRASMAIGFEAFPRRIQPVLDEWTGGRLTADQFLERAEWNKFWKFPPELYLPLFQFARVNRIPMIALNIERPLRDAAVSLPARAVAAYEDFLFDVFRQHAKGKTAARADPSFRSFVDAQLTWDRAMAEALSARVRAPAEARPLIIGIVGAGHVRHGHGIPHQLRDLGVANVVSLLPVHRAECGKLAHDLADAVFVLPDRP